MSNLSLATWVRFLVRLVVGMVVHIGDERRHTRPAPTGENW